MFGSVDKDVVIGFIDEAKSYLPAIRQGLQAYQTDAARLDGLEEAHRHTHTIKGAASMVGLDGLSHIAAYVEEAVEEIGAGQLPLDEATQSWLVQAVDCIETYLESVLNDTLDEEALLAEALCSYHRLRGSAEDEAAFQSTAASAVKSPAEPEPAGPAPEPDPAPAEPEAASDLDFFDEEMATELMDAFFLEAEDHLGVINLSLADLDKNYADKEALQAVRRSVHTLKGTAGMVGLQTLSELAHRMEDLLDALSEDQMTLDRQVMELLFTSAETLEDLTRDEGDQDILERVVQGLYTQYETLFRTRSDQELSEAVGEPVEEPLLDLTASEPESPAAVVAEATQGAAPDPPAPVSKEEAPRRDSSEVVRVPIERLDELIRLIGELVITRTGFEQRVGDLVREVEELRPSIARLRRISTKLETDYEVSTLGSGFRRLAFRSGGASGPGDRPPYAAGQAQEFDELEFDRYTEFHLLSRELAETTSDINTLGSAMGALIGDFDTILNRQERLSIELQEKLMRTRMLPLATLVTRLQRTVRVTARQRQKEVDLVIEGQDIELDKTVLEEIGDTLLHLLRNAVDHGIEPPRLRRAAGKPKRGLIRLQAYHEGNQVVIKVSDDGAGLDPQAIRTKAVANGYISEAEAHQLSEQALYALIFKQGFTTTDQVSEVSGRGVGMDIVRTNVNKLKGTVLLDSDLGQGATFTIRLPMTLAVTQALLIKAHSEIFAMPLNAVSQILRVKREAFDRVGPQPVVRVGGKVYPLLRLGEVLNLNRPADGTVERPPVLVINAGDQEAALLVDHIIRGREIVIKNLGSHLRKVWGVMGATLMGDGQVVLILNPAELLDRPAQAKREVKAPAPSPTRETWNIMIVDDSVSVRRIVANLIKNAGWQATPAKDGLEALEIIQRSAQPPDLVLLDVEMPRMDGYELLTTLRGQAAYKSLPIVMLTSRAGEKHRRKAFALGVSEYLVKPYQDETLLGTVRRLMRASKSAAPV